MRQKIFFLAKTHQLTSFILDEQRSFSVYLPPSYNENPDKVYPVIYLLDGDQTHLKAVAGLVEALSTVQNGLSSKYSKQL